MIPTVKDFSIVSKAEVDVFLEFSCFFDDPADVGSLISGSSVFSKTRLNIWKFTVHVLLKPGLENFKHHFTTMRDTIPRARSAVVPERSYRHVKGHGQWPRGAPPMFKARSSS